MIRVSNIVKYHGDARILDGASVEVRRGQVAALVGPSGGGKSTLLRCINGLEEFQEGEVAVGDSLKLVGGAAPHRSTLVELRRTVGMVFQQFNLFPHMSVLKNVMAGPIHALGKPTSEAETTAKKWLDRVGLGQKFDARPAQLSGGQQQRVAIARALAVNPTAILFDEPTSALDPKMAAEVMRVIDDLADDEQLQVAMVIVTHDIPAVKRIADVVHLLDKGRVVYSGPADEAFTPGGPAEALE
ncbi:glutamine abc transporter atp-binding protein : ABC-type polar amino acid transport system, ATPase component OS=Singulisphaera acidiphila (strain ATCC BAA-1392 / DSM 18658 / VKM B-2454 / MOB10) GN=Sinac_5233 PE=3 SV=1: ABC_tran [Gemmata massiliana]|uniref:ABC transporter domain-containing protein n=1 Tax=Gemmata massiliana TaxID=1210884 RepID=A0A6P2CXN5_9BACT|nr:amino acid ABC transporter ATP-binding protein [Gemmata massiliana]VTR91892.1 glutamine abc transporter atp-binding protein : ABC-type polar amino acid transport system, ATPase component OS=Singulisphaera acidiphila (strain ATCC BAA-1392 / DSM 18658 / VKM B-2454 / MOB10) GN=Sinac_5233 PE=3 SV=1: ABC_tran [Gemmata massiliana]